jgi:hypothetical protein
MVQGYRMKKLLYYILLPYRYWQERRAIRKSTKELKKRNPFIYW